MKKVLFLLSSLLFLGQNVNIKADELLDAKTELESVNAQIAELQERANELNTIIQNLDGYEYADIYENHHGYYSMDLQKIYCTIGTETGQPLLVFEFITDKTESDFKLNRFPSSIFTINEETSTSINEIIYPVLNIKELAHLDDHHAIEVGQMKARNVKSGVKVIAAYPIEDTNSLIHLELYRPGQELDSVEFTIQPELIP